MARKEAFLDWFKKKFESREIIPPEEIFYNIQNQMDIDAVWENIENELDVNEVWGSINEELTVSNQLHWIDRMAYLMVIVVFIAYLFTNVNTVQGPQPMVGNNSSSAQQQDTEMTLSEERNDQGVSGKTPPDDPQNTAFQTNEEKSNRDPGEFTSNNGILNLKAGRNSDDSRQPESEKFIAKDKSKDLFNEGSFISDLSEIERLEPVYNMDPVGSYNKLIPAPDTLFLTTAESPDLGSGFYFGISGTFNNTWLLNPRTFTGLETDKLEDTDITFGREFGISAGYYFNQNWGIETNVDLIDEENQKYNEYIKGKFQSADLSLEYSNVSMVIKRRGVITRWPGTGLSTINIYMGPFVGVLNSATKVHESNYHDVSDFYQQFNYGLSVGGEFESRLSSHLILSTGMKLKYGFNNVYKGDDIIPSYLFKTNTATIGFNASLRYFLTNN